MNEIEIIQKVINLIGNIEDAKVISAHDYTEEREANMIVVGIGQVEQLNVNLPDYKYGLNITIDCFIEDDKAGEIFNDILNTVREKINNYVNKGADLDTAFEGIPIVGWINMNIETSISAESNRAIITSDLIASYN